VHVQIPLEIGVLDEHRKRVLFARLDLAAILAQLRGDPRKLERPVNALLRVAGQTPIAAEEAILAELQSALLRPPASVDVVILAAGEVVQRRTEALGRHHSYVDL